MENSAAVSIPVSTTSSTPAFPSSPSPITEEKVKHVIAREVGPDAQRRRRHHNHHHSGRHHKNSSSSLQGTFSARLVMYGLRQQQHHRYQPQLWANQIKTVCCSTVRELLATLTEFDVASILRSESATPRIFFWLDMHGVPAPGASGNSVQRVWDLLGLDVDTVRHLSAALTEKQKPFLEHHSYCSASHTTLTPSATATPDSRHGHESRTRTTLSTRRTSNVSSPRSSTTGNPSSSSSSSSSSCTDSSNIDPVALAGLLEIYSEDDDMEAPDTVTVHRRMLISESTNTAVATHVQARAQQQYKPTGNFYVAMELATLMAPRANQMVTAAHGWGLPNSIAAEPIGSSSREEVGEAEFSRQGSSVKVAASPESLGRDSRSTVTTFATQGADEVPTVAATYVQCFRAGCVTWCPSSTFHCSERTTHDEDTQLDDGSGSIDGGGGSSLASISDEPPHEEVKGWSKLQEAVFSRLHAATSTQVTPSALSSCSSLRHQGALECMTTTSTFVGLLLSTVCYAYLPDTTAILNEVDAIDAMLPLIVPEAESDQADALRRVLVLRRRLAVHRRLLFRKVKLLEELHKPVMFTLADFMNSAASVYGASITTRARDANAGTRNTILDVLERLDSARVVLGNTTIIYASAVTLRNFTGSTDTDYFQLMVTYITFVSVPLSIAGAQWGLKCYVPWQSLKDTTAPFWGIVAVMLALALLALTYPLWRYRTKRSLMFG